MFLTHDDQRPFFGGTLFPKARCMACQPSPTSCKRVAEYYRTHQEATPAERALFMRGFHRRWVPPPVEAQQINADPLPRLPGSPGAQLRQQSTAGSASLRSSRSRSSIERLLRQLALHGCETGRSISRRSTWPRSRSSRMGEGGCTTSVGGGFCRYSTDSHWMIPHFEKMLYDNAGLMAVYAEAAIATGDMFYAQIAAETAEWLIRDMQSPEGGFYSSFDADSEGHEGKFYVWDRAEVKCGCSRRKSSRCSPAALRARSIAELRRQVVASARVPRDKPRCRRREHGPRACRARAEFARVKLLDLRESRVAPGRDEKILTSWNAMAIRGMAITARMLARDDLAEAATNALDFIRNTLWKDGRLLATYKDGRAHLNAYLDDYVYLADAIFELQQVRFRPDELAFARELLDVTLTHFEDPQGGFFFTSDDHEALIHRIKSYADDAIPAGNGIAAFVLQRMGYLLGESRYLIAADRAVRASWQMLERYPSAATTMLSALEELLTPPEIVILRGEREEVRDAQRQLATVYAPSSDRAVRTE